MTSRLLTDAERDRFATWLEQEAETGELMAAQMDKMAGPHFVLLAKKERVEAMSAKIVAKKLRETQSMTVGG